MKEVNGFMTKKGHFHLNEEDCITQELAEKETYIREKMTKKMIDEFPTINQLTKHYMFKAMCDLCEEIYKNNESIKAMLEQTNIEWQYYEGE